MTKLLPRQTPMERYAGGNAPRPLAHPCPPLGKQWALSLPVSAAAAGPGLPCPWPEAPACRQRGITGGSSLGQRAAAAGEQAARRACAHRRSSIGACGLPDHLSTAALLQRSVPVFVEGAASGCSAAQCSCMTNTMRRRAVTLSVAAGWLVQGSGSLQPLLGNVVQPTLLRSQHCRHAHCASGAAST